MKSVGLALIVIGFLGGSLITVQTSENLVDLNWFIPCLVLGVVGVILARLAARSEAREEGKLAVGFQTLGESLDRIVERIRTLDSEKDGLDPYTLSDRIDAAFRDDVGLFVEARESIAHLYGLAAYAAVMNEFAAGERYLNRVWSASIDGWVDEAQEYIGRARQQFEQAQRQLAGLGGSGGN